MATELNSTLSVTIRAEMTKYMNDMKRAEKIAVGGAMNTVNAYANLTQTLIQVGREVWNVLFAVGKLALQFEDGMSAVWTLTNQTREEVVAMGRELLKMGASSAQATATMTKGLYDSISAGIEVSQSLGFIKVAAETAVAGVTDVATSVDLLTSIVNSYRGQLGETLTTTQRAQKASDILFMTMKYGKTTISQMAGSFGRVTSIAAQVGVSLEQVGAGIASLTLAGLSTDEAITALRQVMVSVLKPSLEASEYAKSLGIDFSAAGLKAMGLANFMKMVRDATKGNAEAMATLFPNVRALAGVMNLAGGGFEKFNEVLAENESSVGAAGEAYAKMAETSSHRIKQFTQTVTNFITELGTAFTEVAADFLRAGDEQKQFIADMSAAIQGFKTVLRVTLQAWQIFKAGVLAVMALVHAGFQHLKYGIEATFAAAIIIWKSAQQAFSSVALGIAKSLNFLNNAMGVKSDYLERSIKGLERANAELENEKQAQIANVAESRKNLSENLKTSRAIFAQAEAARELGDTIGENTRKIRDQKLVEAQSKRGGKEAGKKIAETHDAATKVRAIEFEKEKSVRNYLDETTKYVQKQMPLRTKAALESIDKQKDKLKELQDKYRDVVKEQRDQAESARDQMLEVNLAGKSDKQQKKIKEKAVGEYGERAQQFLKAGDFEGARKQLEKAQSLAADLAKSGGAKSKFEEIQKQIQATYNQEKKTNAAQQNQTRGRIEGAKKSLEALFAEAERSIDIKVNIDEFKAKITEIRGMISDIRRDAGEPASAVAATLALPTAGKNIQRLTHQAQAQQGQGQTRESTAALLGVSKEDLARKDKEIANIQTTYNINITQKMDRQDIDTVLIPRLKQLEKREINTRTSQGK